MIGRNLLRTTNRNPLRRLSPYIHQKPTKLDGFLNCRWYHEVSYQQHGKDPKDSLSYRSDPRIDDLNPPVPIASNTDENPSSPDCHYDGLVRVKMMHVPWNPADINTVQGRYPSPYEYSPIPSIAYARSRSYRNGIRVASDQCIGRYFEMDPVIGSEGWGRITHSVSSSSSVSPGTLVTLGLPGLGTLRSSLWVPESSVVPVPNFVWERLGPAGCSLFQLGGTALRLLSDFVVVEPGDVVLQNAGNSGVGFLASQIASSSLLFGSTNESGDDDDDSSDEYSTPVMVSLIRRRGKSKESFDKTVDYLTRDGKNALVVAEEDFFLPEDTSNKYSSSKDRWKGKAINDTAIREMRQRLRDLSSTGSLPKLALNAIGGDSARLMLKLLEPNAGSTMITYGGMSGKGVQVATPQLIFRDVCAVGYWHSRWMVREHKQERAERRRQAQGETDSRSSNQNKPNNRRAAMVDLLSVLVKEENLKCPPAHVVRLEDLQDGLLWQENQSDRQYGDPSRQSPIRRKLIWDCGEHEQDKEHQTAGQDGITNSVV